MKLGCAMPMGPLTLADFIGLDTCLAIIQVCCVSFYFVCFKAENEEGQRAGYGEDEKRVCDKEGGGE